MPASYDLNKIKFATDEAMFKRVVGLYESGKVTEAEALGGYYSARNYKQEHCTYYLGRKRP